MLYKQLSFCPYVAEASKWLIELKKGDHLTVIIIGGIYNLLIKLRVLLETLQIFSGLDI